MAKNNPNYKFRITQPGFKPDLLGALLTLALKETELIHGRAKVKLETAYRLSIKRPTCLIEGGTECGEHLAKLFTGFLIKQVGENGFVVRRSNQPATS